MSSQKTFRVARYVATCAVAALSFAATAHAGDALSEVDVATATVRYADLNLSKQADAQTLYGRLKRASDQVCGEYKVTRDLHTMRLYKECYQDTLARAVDDVGHAAVKAVHVADDRARVASRGVKSQSRT